jgi:hypothetical protein
VFVDRLPQKAQELLDSAGLKRYLGSAYAPITKNHMGKVQASLRKLSEVRIAITPDLVKRVDSGQMECPKCGEKLQIKTA